MMKWFACLACLVFLATPNLVAQNVKDITATEANNLINTGKVSILDVRTPAEWNQGHLKGAVLQDVMDKQFKSKVSKLDKSKPIVVYCAVGGRSAYAADDMVKLGFQKVYNLVGGIKAWTKAGFSTEK